MLLKQKESKKVRNHEDLLNNDPFKDEVAQREPAKCIKPLKPKRPPPSMKERITDVPSFKIKELNQVLKEHAKSYGIELQDNLHPLNHFTKTKLLVESHLKHLLITTKGFTFVETLEVTFERKQSIQKLESV